MKNIFNVVKKDDVEFNRDVLSCQSSENIAFHKTLEINSSLDLDCFSDPFRNDKIDVDGLYVEGDLKVSGNIFGGSCAFLYVGGDLYVDSLFCTDDELKIHIDGNLYVKHFLETNEDSYFVVKGEINNLIRIHAPHAHYIENQLKNTPICFIDYDVIEFWGDIVDESWDKFLNEHKDFNEDEDAIECPVDFVRAYWSFYQTIVSKQSIFPKEMLEELNNGNYFDEKLASEETFKMVFDFIKSEKLGQPSEEHCEEY